MTATESIAALRGAVERAEAWEDRTGEATILCLQGTADGRAILDERDSLLARIETLEADAARYQWLRAQHWNDAEMCVVHAPTRNIALGSDCPSLDRLDAAIDAARKDTK